MWVKGVCWCEGTKNSQTWSCVWSLSPFQSFINLAPRKFILQTRMLSHPVGLDVWFLVDPLSTSILHVCEQRRLARLCECAGSPKSSLVAYVISNIISWAGSFGFFFRNYHFVSIFGKSSMSLSFMVNIKSHFITQITINLCKLCRCIHAHTNHYWIFDLVPTSHFTYSHGLIHLSIFLPGVGYHRKLGNFRV